MPNLHSAAKSNNTEEALLCIQRNDDVNMPSQDEVGYLPLHTCAAFNATAVATLLIQNGADVNSQSSGFGDSPLHIAVSHGHASFAEFLVENGANTVTQNNEGQTPAQQPDAEELIVRALETNSFSDWNLAIEKEQESELNKLKALFQNLQHAYDTLPREALSVALESQRQELERNINAIEAEILQAQQPQVLARNEDTTQAEMIELINNFRIQFPYAPNSYAALLRAFEEGEFETIDLLRNEIEVLQLLLPPQHRPLADDRNEGQPAPIINYAQSVHNNTVHQAVSASATKLMNRYGSIIAHSGLENILSKAQAQVLNLGDESIKNQAAKRCIQRLLTEDCDFNDSVSSLTIKQLLALTFLAISDDSQRTGHYKDAIAQFVEGLYEIQRGYNLSDEHIDTGDEDLPICPGGTFNKLIEKLQGIHPECEIHFMTRQTAALKLPKIVQEEALHYLSQLANPDNKKELIAFTKLIATLKKEGLAVIYECIKNKISHRMFDEFGALYHDDTDPLFTNLIDAGEYTAVNNLSQFQEQIQSSKGYHQYCSEILRFSIKNKLFFSSSKQSEQESFAAKNFQI